MNASIRRSMGILMKDISLNFIVIALSHYDNLMMIMMSQAQFLHTHTTMVKKTCKTNQVEIPHCLHCFVNTRYSTQTKESTYSVPEVKVSPHTQKKYQQLHFNFFLSQHNWWDDLCVCLFPCSSSHWFFMTSCFTLIGQLIFRRNCLH